MRILLAFLIGFSTIVVAQLRQSPFVKSSNVCPDQKTKCPATATCCVMDDGTYGCCPLKNAVCCDDHIHCCPPGTTCDVEEGRCNRNGVYVPIHKKHAGTKGHFRDDIQCPDGKSKCPAETTCCLMSMGSYGCCPMPEATCCNDRMHCCPHGYNCDTSGQRCVGQDENDEVPIMKKFAATPIIRKKGIAFDAPIDDESSESSESVENLQICGKIRCPTSSTCCASSRFFGENTHRCCPLNEAVCCDGYCCPNGFQCSKGKTCEKRARSQKKMKQRENY